MQNFALTFSFHILSPQVSTTGASLHRLSGSAGESTVTAGAPSAFHSFPWIADLVSNKLSVLRFVEAVKKVNA
jgi:hypothetical protein